MDFNSVERIEGITIFSSRRLQQNWDGVYYVAVLMHYLDEAVEVSLATNTKILHTLAKYYLRDKNYLIFSSLYRECSKLTASKKL